MSTVRFPLYEQPIIEDDFKTFLQYKPDYWADSPIFHVSNVYQSYELYPIDFQLLKVEVSYERCSLEENPAQLDLNLHCFYSVLMIQAGRFLFYPDK